ncbi:MAG: helix-turn-helix domain-containing protein, partial [Candidatus Acidiferrales bacterium]
HRLRLVESAKQIGIRPTARLFATTVPTVRKWLRRYQQQGPSGLIAHSRAPHRSPQKTSAEIEQQVLALRRRLPTFGAARLKREFDLPVSHMAIQRIWRAQGLMKKRRRKYQRKQDLAHIKAQWALFQQISADTKDLDDIPRYWPQARRLGLPIIQYTARDVRSACCSGRLPNDAVPQPAPFLLPAFSSTPCSVCERGAFVFRTCRNAGWSAATASASALHDLQFCIAAHVQVLKSARFSWYSAQISNRYNKLLETPVTCSKQTPAPISNRYKNRFSPRHPLSSRLALVGRNRRYRAEGVRNTPGHLAPHSFTLRNEGPLATVFF